MGRFSPKRHKHGPITNFIPGWLTHGADSHLSPTRQQARPSFAASSSPCPVPDRHPSTWRHGRQRRPSIAGASGRSTAQMVAHCCASDCESSHTDECTAKQRGEDDLNAEIVRGPGTRVGPACLKIPRQWVPTESNGLGPISPLDGWAGRPPTWHLPAAAPWRPVPRALWRRVVMLVRIRRRRCCYAWNETKFNGSSKTGGRFRVFFLRVNKSFIA
jgi:hypothetical protein